MIGPYYKPQITSILSITHRITGAGLGLGALLVTAWLAAAAWSDTAFDALQSFRGSIIGQVMLFGWLFAFVFHFFNGIRHLKWDMGYGLNMKSVYRTGYVVIAATVIVTCLIWSSV